MKLQVPFPMIYLPRYMTMEPEAKLGFYGEFEVIKKRRGIITQVLKFRNVITDVGLKYIAANLRGTDDVTDYCQLGTGTTTPVSSDTTLESYGTHKRSDSCVVAGGATNDRYFRQQFEFDLSDVIGTWTELGMSWTYGSGSNVFCRMLFKDDDGNPISITKTSDDTMTIIYYLHIVRSSDTPTENTITVDDVDYTVQSLITNDVLRVASYGGTPLPTGGQGGTARLGTGTDELSTTQTACHTPISISPTLYSVVSYVSGTVYREVMFEFPARVTGNIAEFVFPGWYAQVPRSGYIAMRFPTPIPKTDTTKKIRLQPRITFARAAA
jgi:hypothetical protein